MANRNKLQIPEILNWDKNGKLIPMEVTGKGNAILIKIPDYCFPDNDFDIDWKIEYQKLEAILIRLLGNQLFWKLAYENRWNQIYDAKMLSYKLQDFIIKLTSETNQPETDLGFFVCIRILFSIARQQLSPLEYTKWENIIKDKIVNLSLQDSYFIVLNYFDI